MAFSVLLMNWVSSLHSLELFVLRFLPKRLRRRRLANEIIRDNNSSTLISYNNIIIIDFSFSFSIFSLNSHFVLPLYLLNIMMEGRKRKLNFLMDCFFFSLSLSILYIGVVTPVKYKVDDHLVQCWDPSIHNTEI